MPGTDDRDDSSEILLETETGYRTGGAFPDSQAEELTIDDRGGLLAQHQAEMAEDSGRAKVVVVSGVDDGRKFELTGRNVSVGRGMDNDIVLTDLAVSRRHLRIDKEGQSYFLQDQGSGNGTLLNGRDEDGRALLRHGDRIEIGNTVLRFEFPRLTLGYTAEPIKRPGPSMPPPAAAPPRGPSPSTSPPSARPSSRPDEVETQGQRPFGPRPSDAPPPPPPGARAEPNLPPLGGFAPIPPPSNLPTYASPTIPPQPAPNFQPPVVSYPSAPPNYSTMNAVSAMRPRPEVSHSPYPEARPMLARARNVPWMWVGVSLFSAALIGTTIFLLRPGSGGEVAQPNDGPDVRVVAAADAAPPVAAQTAAAPDAGTLEAPVVEPPRIALLSGKLQPGDLPKEAWGTDETRVNQITTTDTPPVAPNLPPGQVSEALQQARLKATELYEQRSFSEASKIIKDAIQQNPGPAASKLNGLARDYAALDDLFDRGQRTAKSDPAAAYRAYSSARRLDARLGGTHKAFLSSRLRSSAAGAASRFMKGGDYAAAREAAIVAGAEGSDILQELEEEAERQVNAARRLADKKDQKSNIMARALLKKARNMVASDSSTYQKATEILERLENR